MIYLKWFYRVLHHFYNGWLLEMGFPWFSYMVP